MNIFQQTASWEVIVIIHLSYNALGKCLKRQDRTPSGGASHSTDQSPINSRPFDVSIVLFFSCSATHFITGLFVGIFMVHSPTITFQILHWLYTGCIIWPAIGPVIVNCQEPVMEPEWGRESSRWSEWYQLYLTLFRQAGFLFGTWYYTMR